MYRLRLGTQLHQDEAIFTRYSTKNLMGAAIPKTASLFIERDRVKVVAEMTQSGLLLGPSKAGQT